MPDTPATLGPNRFEVKVTADSHLGWVRTRLSLERTMMSWVRTATALIGFGFAIVQYLDHLAQFPGARQAYLPYAPEYLGLALIACGILALVVAIAQYQWALHYLAAEPFTPIAQAREGGIQTPILAVAIFLAAIGVFAFFAVLYRLA